MVALTNTVDTFCHQCHMKCRVRAHVADGAIQRIEGASCAKGRYAHLDVYHPARIKFPMKRVSQRGSGQWQRISWDEALEVIANKLETIRSAFGPEAICVAKGCAHKENATIASLALAYLLGTPNLLDAGYMCNTNASVAQAVTFGDYITGDLNVDYQASKCILIWGANPAETRIPQYKDIRRAMASGARLIVVDPRPTEMAKRATIWLRVRPGADAALALAMVNVIVTEELYDRPFVTRWCHGFEELKEHISQYTPERVAPIAWVAEEQIVEAARLFATVKPACLHARLGPGALQANATQASRAIAILLALAGNIDVPGGNLLSNNLGGFKPIFQVRRFFRLPAEVEMKRFGATQFPLQCGSQVTAPGHFHAHYPGGIAAMLKGEVKAFIVCGNNTVVQEGNSREVWEALRKLDLLAVMELSMTPTAELADILLPAAHWLETEGPTSAFTGKYNSILARQKVIDPVGEARDDRQVVIDLARRMGLRSPWQNLSEFNDLRLKEVGITFEELKNSPGHSIAFPVYYRKYEEQGFGTPTSKAELYSTILYQQGYPALPSHEEPPESPYSTPALFQEYPIILIQSRHRAIENSEYHQIVPLRELMPEPIIEINPETANVLGIQEGGRIGLKSPHFPWQIEGKASLVTGIHPNVASTTHGWWFPEEGGPEHGCFRANSNSIISNTPPYDPINGNYQVRAVLCKALAV